MPPTASTPPPGADTEQDVWARLREYCEHGHLLRHPPLTEEQAREMERRTGFSPADCDAYTFIRSDYGVGWTCYPPIVLHPRATAEQLRATEERLGFPLPADLRRLYAEVANGGRGLGACHIFFGADELVPDCGERTIEEQASASGWRLHPRIEEALLRHPRSYVISDSIPDGFLHVAGDSEISVEIDAHTGRVYRIGGWGWLPDRPPDAPLGSFELFSIELYAPSLGEWFARWIDDTLYDRSRAFELLPEMVDTSGLPDPKTAWRELYRFGPAFALRPDDADDNAGDDWGDDWGDG